MSQEYYCCNAAINGMGTIQFESLDLYWSLWSISRL